MSSRSGSLCTTSKPTSVNEHGEMPRTRPVLVRCHVRSGDVGEQAKTHLLERGDITWFGAHAEDRGLQQTGRHGCIGLNGSRYLIAGSIELGKEGRGVPCVSLSQGNDQTRQWADQTSSQLAVVGPQRGRCCWRHGRVGRCASRSGRSWGRRAARGENESRGNQGEGCFHAADCRRVRLS